jgi:dTDP-4-amino-4,6-dideoxygalactose transaminase
MVIPFLDLRTQYQNIKSEVDAAVLQVLESGNFVLGPEVEAFEREFAAYSGASAGIALNSGTSALHLALLAIGVGPGDEVITTPFTFVATVAAIVYAGARPVLVDVDPETLTMDPALISAAVTPRTKAILPVHIHGRPAEMNGIMAAARGANLRVIEDAAQAHGASYQAHGASSNIQPIGSIGDLACFSFYPGKNLGAYGEGGLVTTSNGEFERLIRQLRDWGQQGKYNHVLKGYNYRMEGIQGAVLRVKLRHLQAWTDARRERAALYDRLLEDSPVQRPVPTPGHVYHVYAVRTANRKALQEHLQAQEIQTGIHYPVPVHLLPAYGDLGYSEGSFPHSERAAQEVLSLPLYPEMTDEHVQTVCEAIRQFA